MGNRMQNVHNLIPVKIIKNDCPSLKHFVPSILLFNTMSLAPKIDEIAYTIKTVDADIGLFTETWLCDTVPDIFININHYQLYRRDRVNRLHGGVCMYVKDSIHCKILEELNHSDHEVLWANLRTKRLPRGISNIIVAVVYQPPAADDATMKDYLISSLEILEIKYPNCAIVLAGDFNKTLLPLLQSAVKVFQLKRVVDFPTRGDRTLDQIFTNLTEYFSSPCSLPAFGLSDHQTIFILARICDKTSKPKRKLITTRDKRPSKIASVGRFLQQVPWSDLFSPAQSSEDKLNILTDIIHFGLNTIMPVSTIKIHESDRPWMITNLKQLISHRQKAFTSGNNPLYKILRNKVNQACKRCRKSYYINKVKGFTRFQAP